MCATPRCSLMRAVITWCWGGRTVDNRGEVLVLESTDRQHRMTLPHVLTHDGQGHILQSPAPELTACRGAAVALPDGAEQAVDVCFDLDCRPGGRLLAGL